MAITRDANYIYVALDVGDPVGDSAVNPYTMQHILDKDVAETWGHVSNVGNSYLVDGRGIYIRNGAYFKIDLENVEFINTPANYYFFANLNGGGVALTRGRFVRTGGKYSYYNSNVVLDRFVDMPYRTYLLSEIKNSTFIGNQITYIYSTADISYTDFINLTYGLLCVYNFTNTNIRVIDSGGTLDTWHMLEDITVNKIEAINCTNHIRWGPNTALKTLTMLDCNLSPELYTFYLTAADGERKGIFQGTIEWMFGDNVDVKVYNAQDDLVLDKTVNNGDSDILTWANIHLASTGAVVTTEELIWREPFKIIISKTDYLDLEIPDMYLTEEFGATRKGYITEIILRGTLILISLQITAIDITDVSKVGATDGQLVVTATGGDGSYEYSIDNVNWQASDTFAGLAAGSYTVYVRDGQTPAFTDSFAVKVPLVTEIKDRLILF